MKKLTDLPTRDVPISLPTPTKEIWQKLMRHLTTLGVRWKDNRPLDFYDNWDTYGKDTHITLYDTNRTTYGSSPFRGSKVVKWEPLSGARRLRKRIGTRHD